MRISSRAVSAFLINSIILDNCFDCGRERLMDGHRGERERKQVERTECTTREDRKENDRKDVGGRRVNASGHCQPEDP